MILAVCYYVFIHTFVRNFWKKNREKNFCKNFYLKSFGKNFLSKFCPNFSNFCPPQTALYSYETSSKVSSGIFFVHQMDNHSVVKLKFKIDFSKKSIIFDSFFENILTGGSIWQIKKCAAATRGGYHVRKFEMQRTLTKKISP